MQEATAPSVAERDETWPARGYAWYVASLLTVAYAIAILDRVSIALLIEPLEASLHLSDTQFGLLQGLAFSIVYSVLGLPIGLICDRSRRVVILFAGLVVWSLATVGCSLASNFHELFLARMMVGVGEAALVPVATSLIADYFAPQMRPRAYGLFVTGSSLGTAGAMALSGLFLRWAEDLITGVPAIFGAMEPWQIVFILCGSPGLVLAAILIVTVREPARKGASELATKISLKPVLALFRKQPAAFGCFTLGTVLNLVCVYAIVGWFPALFIRVHGWSASYTGYALGAVGLPISIFAALNSGWVISWLQQRGHRDAPVLAAIGCGISMATLGTAACLIPDATGALIAYGANALFVNWNISAVYSGFSAITPNRLRGQIMAIQTICSGLIALTAGNFFVGFFSDTVFNSETGISRALALVFFACGLSAVLVLAAGRRGFRDAITRAAADAS